jgi:hypothetical protein
MSGRGLLGVPLLALLNSAAEVVVLPQLGRQKAQEAVALLDWQGTGKRPSRQPFRRRLGGPWCHPQQQGAVRRCKVMDR